MKFEVDILKPQDLPMIHQWWKESGVEGPHPEFIPSTSYLLRIEGKPAASVSLLMTNANVAWVDHLIGNPEMKGPERREGIEFLQKALELIAHGRGIKRLFCMSQKRSTSKRYQQLGYVKSSEGIETMIKEIN